MRKTYMLLLLLMLGLLSQAQQVVSGFVEVEDSLQWESSVSLFKINLEDDMTPHGALHLATVPIQGNGFFAFDSSLFDNQERVYKLQFNPGYSNSKKYTPSKFFILSNDDSLILTKAEGLVTEYINSNLADVELQNFQQMQADHDGLNHPANNRVYKDYVKDSLEILLVKLMGVNLLKEKELLDQDIETNQAYYVALVEDFKSSDIMPVAYAFLESRCAVIGQQVLERKYKRSLFFNVLFGLFLVFGLVFFLIRSKRQKASSPAVVQANLSRQETIIKDLIVQGKTNKEIAAELFVSISTVKTHITNLYSKLGVSGRKEVLAEG